jgi:hypothetical protein
MRFVHLGLRSRLYLGFAVLVAFGQGMAGYGMLGLSNVTKSVGKMDAISGNVIRVQSAGRRIRVREGCAVGERFADDRIPAG